MVFNAAAYTDVDRAESEPAAAEAVNAAGAENVARAAAAAGAAVVHYSTDFVFDGEQERPYDENDPPSPQGRYAASKADGERGWRRRAERHFILRVGCLYGRGGRNFPSTIVRRLRAGETIRADNDRWARRPGRARWPMCRRRSRAPHITAFTTAPPRARPPGPTSPASRPTILGVPAERVRGVSTAELPLKAQRPRRAILDNRRLREHGLDSLSSWQDALRAFIAEETG